MDLTSHNEEEKAKLQSAIEAIDQGQYDQAKQIIQECIAGEDEETAMDKQESVPSIKDKLQKVMSPRGEMTE